MNETRRATMGEKINFGVGQIAEGLKNTTFSVLILFYYNQVLEVSGTLCGLALGIALIFDAITDPLAGSLSDNWRSPLGRRHPFMYASAIPLAICFYLVFSPPDMGETGLFLWLTATAILTRAAMTLYHVPHLALGAEMSQNYEERTVLVSLRQSFGYIGALITLALAFLVFFAPSEEYANGQLDPDAYSPFALVVAALMVITIWQSAWGTRKTIPYLPVPLGEPEPISVKRVFGELKLAVMNRSFRWLFGGVIVIYLMVGVDYALNLYVNTYFWELKPREIFLFTIGMPIGILAGAFATRALHAHWGKRAGMIIGTSGYALCQIIPIALRLMELMPENGTTILLVILVSSKFIQGFLVMQSLASFGSMVADIADEHELLTGKRQEGIFFGASSFANKSASGLGTLAAGLVLDLINWPVGSDINSASDIPGDTLFQLGLTVGPVLASFGIISVWCFSFYELTRERHEEILTELSERRAAAGSKTALDTESF